MLTPKEKSASSVDRANGACGPNRCDRGYDIRADTNDAPLPAIRPIARLTPRP
jgi:hypothetical protein